MLGATVVITGEGVTGISLTVIASESWPVAVATTTEVKPVVEPAGTVTVIVVALSTE